MPLLVGLLHSSASHRDGAIPLHNGNGASGYQEGDINLEELAAKQTAGGGMIDSIANMANSILGAGEDNGCQICFACSSFISFIRNYRCASAFGLLLLANLSFLLCHIGLPYAVSQAGFFTGILLLVFLCGVTDWTIRLIVINAKLSGRHSYIEIMNHCFGPSGRSAVSFFQFAFAFGGEI